MTLSGLPTSRRMFLAPVSLPIWPTLSDTHFDDMGTSSLPAIPHWAAYVCASRERTCRSGWSLASQARGVDPFSTILRRQPDHELTRNSHIRHDTIRGG